MKEAEPIRPKAFISVITENEKYITVNLNHTLAWDIDGNYLGELIEEKIDNGIMYSLKPKNETI